jgi:hypothetical protein
LQAPKVEGEISASRNPRQHIHEGVLVTIEQEETVTMMETIKKVRVSDDALDLMFRKPAFPVTAADPDQR